MNGRPPRKTAGTGKRRFRSLFFRFTLVFVLTIVPVILLQIYLLYSSYRDYEEKIIELVREDTNKREQIVSMEVMNYKALLFKIVLDSNVIQSLQAIKDAESGFEQKYQTVPLRKTLMEYNYSSRDGLAMVAILSGENTYAYRETYDVRTTESDVSTSNFWEQFPDVTETEYYQVFSCYYGDAGFLPPIRMEGVNPQKPVRYVCMMGEKICNLSDIEQLGVAVFGILEDHLDDMCNKNSSQGLSYAFIIDEEGRIVTNEDDSLIGRHVDEVLTLPGGSLHDLLQQETGIVVREGSYDGQRALVSYTRISETPWALVSFFQYDYLFSSVHASTIISVVLLIVAVLIMLVIITAFTRSITADVHRLAQTIRQGEYEEGAESANNELDLIVSSYHALWERFLAAMDHLSSSANREKQLEIRALESQINPHFLYNTLDCINWLAIENDQEEISELLSRLASIMRYSVNRSNYIVPLREDIQWMDSYLFLQQKRFSGRFAYQIEAAPEVEHFPVHKLMMQPFLENAVIHGFQKSGRRDGELFITMGPAPDGTRLECRIRDNGGGMTPRQVEEYFRSGGGCARGRHIGVSNILERLQIYFGSAYQIDVRSAPDQGTEIVLIIPPAEGEGEEMEGLSSGL